MTTDSTLPLCWADIAGDSAEIAETARVVGIPAIAVTHIVDALVEGGGEDITVDAGGTGDGSFITPTRAWTSLRHGGVGADAWLARVTGTHPQYKFERKFVEAAKNLSRSGRSGIIRWTFTDPGLYSFGRFCGGRYEASGFFVTDGFEITEVTAEHAALIAGAMDLDLADLFDN